MSDSVEIRKTADVFASELSFPDKIWPWRFENALITADDPRVVNSCDGQETFAVRKTNYSGSLRTSQPTSGISLYHTRTSQNIAKHLFNPAHILNTKPLPPLYASVAFSWRA